MSEGCPVISEWGFGRVGAGSQGERYFNGDNGYGDLGWHSGLHKPRGYSPRKRVWKETTPMFARKEFPKFVVSTIKPQVNATFARKDAALTFVDDACKLKESKGQIMFDHNDDLSNSVVFLADVKTDDEIQFTASRLKGLPEFINALYAWANSKGAKNVLFYIHGFNVQPQNAFSQWRKLKRQFGVANGPRTIVVP
eukprot:1331403-Amorphochlora_amoeboformis.AAC.1